MGLWKKIINIPTYMRRNGTVVQSHERQINDRSNEIDVEPIDRDLHQNALGSLLTTEKPAPLDKSQIAERSELERWIKKNVTEPEENFKYLKKGLRNLNVKTVMGTIGGLAAVAGSILSISVSFFFLPLAITAALFSPLAGYFMASRTIETRNAYRRAINELEKKLDSNKNKLQESKKKIDSLEEEITSHFKQMSSALPVIREEEIFEEEDGKGQKVKTIIDSKGCVTVEWGTKPWKEYLYEEADFSPPKKMHSSFDAPISVSQANLKKVKFNRTKIENKFFVENSNLKEANFSHTLFKEESSFAGSNLKGSDFRNCTFEKPSNFDGANLSGSLFHHSTLSGSMRNVNFTGVNLSGADLRSVTSLEGSSFKNTIMKGAVFPRNIEGLDLTAKQFEEVVDAAGGIEHYDFKKIKLSEVPQFLNCSESQFEYLVVTGVVPVYDLQTNKRVEKKYDAERHYISEFHVRGLDKLLRSQ